MAISLAKKFIRQISQPFDHTQTGISLWTLEDIQDKQRKDKEELDKAKASGFLPNDNIGESQNASIEEIVGQRDMRDGDQG